MLYLLLLTIIVFVSGQEESEELLDPRLRAERREERRRERQLESGKTEDEIRKQKEIRKAKKDARAERKNQKVAKKNSVIAEYMKQGSEYIAENYDTFDLGKKFVIAKKYTQKKNLNAKVEAKKKLQRAQVARFKKEFVEDLGLDVPDNIFAGSLDNQERKMWSWAKRYQAKIVSDYKKALKKHKKELKAYKRRMREIKNENIDAHREGKALQREMRNVKKKQQKFLKGSDEYEAEKTKYNTLKDQREEVMKKINEEKGESPKPSLPELYQMDYAPRARKLGRAHGGVGKVNELIGKLSEKNNG